MNDTQLNNIASLDSIAADLLQNLKGIFFDLDDTFTSNGRIPACSFASLWDLKGAGLKIVVVTGRPAGWCDHIARMWPVDGVIGENGAFYFWLDEKKRKLNKCFMDALPIRVQNRQRLARVRDEILTRVAGSAIASDQQYRESDLAIDYCEDVARLSSEAIAEICRIFKSHGATCKVSSIHVNGWFGQYDKLGMVKRFAKERLGLELDVVKERFAYCGDSPNDEPMFEYFPVSIGVKNVLQFMGQLQTLPSYVTSKEGGEGFTEFVSYILKCRHRS